MNFAPRKEDPFTDVSMPAEEDIAAKIPAQAFEIS
jgi:hypothetical protein